MVVLLNGLVLRGIGHASRLQLVALVRHITTDYNVTAKTVGARDPNRSGVAE